MKLSSRFKKRFLRALLVLPAATMLYAAPACGATAPATAASATGTVDANGPQRIALPPDLTGLTCCPKPTGCTRTQGYWKSKPGVVWPSPYNRNAKFFSSGLTWQEVLDTPPKGGNAYLILAHQYIAAVLNRARGASAPPAVQRVIDSATAFFSSGTNLDTCGESECEAQKNWAAILDTYNNGRYPDAPLHCRD